MPRPDDISRSCGPLFKLYKNFFSKLFLRNPLLNSNDNWQEILPSTCTYFQDALDGWSFTQLLSLLKIIKTFWFRAISQKQDVSFRRETCWKTWHEASFPRRTLAETWQYSSIPIGTSELDRKLGNTWHKQSFPKRTSGVT